MNRSYIATSIADRGDEHFDNYAEGHRVLVIEHETGCCTYHVPVDGPGTILGQFNFFEIRQVSRGETRGGSR